MKVRTPSESPPRPAPSWLLGLASLGVLLAACRDQPYSRDAAPFSCAGNGQCPAGYRCASDLCVRNGAEAPPVLVGRSSGLFTPSAHSDPDRGGVLSCWTTDEDRETTRAAVTATFVSPDGTVHPAQPLTTFDSTGRVFLTDCAPIPRTDGKILVALWLQRNGAAVLRLMVWTPATANGFVGESRMFYEEPAGVPQIEQRPGFLEVDVVGDQVWIPFDQELDVSVVGGRGRVHRYARLRVGAAELAAGAPVRDVVLEAQGFGFAGRVRHSVDGAWMLFGTLASSIGYYDSTGGTQYPYFEVEPPLSLLLATNQVTSDTGMLQEQVALYFSDPLQLNNITPYTRVIWLTRRTRQIQWGPRMPFHRIDNFRPGALRRGDDLYIFASQVGTPVAARALDGGVDEDAGQVALPDGGQPDLPLVMYRIPWGADDAQSVERVRTIVPRAARAQALAAAAEIMPNSSEQAFALIWVEFYPPDDSGHGARYAAYAGRFAF